MRLPLRLHPDFRCTAARDIEVEVVRPRPGRLELRYAVCGAITELNLPAPAAPERTDELWRHTCFEAFLRGGPGEGYYEFNFAPSSRWAAYRFDGYRRGMAPAEPIAAPAMEARTGAGRYELGVSLDLDRLPDVPDGAWSLGLTAVIEDVRGDRSYWALTHPPGKPDFHHPDGFAYELSAADRP